MDNKAMKYGHKKLQGFQNNLQNRSQHKRVLFLIKKNRLLNVIASVIKENAGLNENEQKCLVASFNAEQPSTEQSQDDREKQEPKPPAERRHC